MIQNGHPSHLNRGPSGVIGLNTSKSNGSMNQNLSSPAGSWSHGPGLSNAGSGVTSANASAAQQQQQSHEAKAPPHSPESSNQSGSVLKEHDLLGLSEVSSSASRGKSSQSAGYRDSSHEYEELNLNLGATELTLGPSAGRNKSEVGFTYHRAPVPEQGLFTVDNGSFLKTQEGANTAGDQGSVAVEKSDVSEQNVAAPEQSTDRCSNYGGGVRVGDRVLPASTQGGRVDATGGPIGRFSPEEREKKCSETLQKWNAELSSERRGPNEGLCLGISLLNQRGANQESMNERKVFLNSVDRNREKPQELQQHTPDDGSFKERQRHQDRNIHSVIQEDVPSADTTQQRPASERASVPNQQVPDKGMQEMAKQREVYVPEKLKTLPPLQPSPEQRFQDMSVPERSPRVADFAKQHWHQQMLKRSSEVSRTSTPPDFLPHSATQQDLDGRPGFAVAHCGYAPGGARGLFAPSGPKPGVAGAKRNYDAIGISSDTRNFGGEVRAGSCPGAGGSMNSPNGPTSEAEAKGLCQQQLKAQPSAQYSWGPKVMTAPSWQMGLDGGGSFGPFPSVPSGQRPSRSQSMCKNPAETGGKSKSWEAFSKSQQEAVTALAQQKMPPSSETKQGASDISNPSTSEPARPAAPAAVGWPPLRSFRKNTLAVQQRPTPVEAQPRPSAPSPVASTAPATNQSNSWYVKVYMDGVPIGRKVDLKTNCSYKQLNVVLEDMFRIFVNGQQDPREVILPSDSTRSFLEGSDYVLTFEDREGDLMLVGDVPWGMFMETVKRLRIMKGSEAIGLGNRGAEKVKATSCNV